MTSCYRLLAYCWRSSIVYRVSSEKTDRPFCSSHTHTHIYMRACAYAWISTRI